MWPCRDLEVKMKGDSVHVPWRTLRGDGPAPEHPGFSPAPQPGLRGNGAILWAGDGGTSGLWMEPWGQGPGWEGACRLQRAEPGLPRDGCG